MTGRGRRILLAWELGAGMGHARRLLIVAKFLKGLGWLPIVAARHLEALADLYAAAGIDLIQAPICRTHGLPKAPFQARSYADVLAISGYASPDLLRPVLTAWDTLLDLVRPEVVVMDFSPILTLAAYGKVPVVAIGTGFGLPPASLPSFPLLRRVGSQLPDEDRLMEVVADLQRQRNLPVPPTLPAAIGGDVQVVCTLCELDVYDGLRETPATGPVEEMPEPPPPSPQPAIFAYLAADFAGTPPLLQEIARSGLPASVFVRNASAELTRQLTGLGMHVHAKPPSLDRVLAQASLVVHHGGLGTAETALALGRPQFLLPRHLEQLLNTEALMRLGVAQYLTNATPLEQSCGTMAAIATEPDLQTRAQSIADALQRRRPWTSLDRIENACTNLSSRPRGCL
jgi:hypothetical protein